MKYLSPSVKIFIQKPCLKNVVVSLNNLSSTIGDVGLNIKSLNDDIKNKSRRSFVPRVKKYI